jgi:hypothetical protein
MTCWSCYHYIRAQHGPHEGEHLRRTRSCSKAPFATPDDCQDFVYEPGSDEVVEAEIAPDNSQINNND